MNSPPIKKINNPPNQKKNTNQKNGNLYKFNHHLACGHLAPRLRRHRPHQSKRPLNINIMEQRIKNLRFAIGVLEQLQAEGPYNYSKEIAAAKKRLSELQSKKSITQSKIGE